MGKLTTREYKIGVSLEQVFQSCVQTPYVLLSAIEDTFRGIKEEDLVNYKVLDTLPKVDVVTSNHINQINVSSMLAKNPDQYRISEEYKNQKTVMIDYVFHINGSFSDKPDVTRTMCKIRVMMGMVTKIVDQKYSDFLELSIAPYINEGFGVMKMLRDPEVPSELRPIVSTYSALVDDIVKHVADRIAKLNKTSLLTEVTQYMHVLLSDNILMEDGKIPQSKSHIGDLVFTRQIDIDSPIMVLDKNTEYGWKISYFTGRIAQICKDTSTGKFVRTEKDNYFEYDSVKGFMVTAVNNNVDMTGMEKVIQDAIATLMSSIPDDIHKEVVKLLS